MKSLLYFLVFVPIVFTAQPRFSISVSDSIALEADTFWGADSFGNLYYTQGNVFYKKAANKVFSFYALSLGDISSVDLLNPLKITLFYKDFNRAIVLDNQLSEIQRIDFNTNKTYRMVAHCTTSYERNLWVFNVDLQQLELYNYAQDKALVATQPIADKVKAQLSNYNFCWLLTEQRLIQYNIYGSPVSEFPLQNASKAHRFKDSLLFVQDGKLFYFDVKFRELIPIPLEKTNFKDFSITNDKLYLYQNNQLTVYNLSFQP
ncbi:MAG: hypothetical protein CO119_03295 [Flavobacteriales bacterium CG_4_9_14_3_um_filter_40_17]|nr:MAG: hypothetical protein CO119_03295 [Flavobacteriales bacterium CG_4_9_14_3_um_filter_40_17]